MNTVATGSMRNDHLRLSRIQKRSRRKSKLSYKKLEVSITQEEMVAVSANLIAESKMSLSFSE